jgi:hypothetical protein
MPTNDIAKQGSLTFPVMTNTAKAAGILYYTVDGFIYYDDEGSARTIVNEEETQTITGNKTFSGTTTFSGAVATTAAGQIQFRTTTITNTQFLAIRATPISCIPAPGVGFVNQFLAATISIDYTAAYTETDDNLAFKYTDGSGAQVSATVETTGFVDLTADSMVNVGPFATQPVLMTTNAAVVLHNTGNGEFGGGDAANVITVTAVYRVVPFPL